jgi:hypothetical protein
MAVREAHLAYARTLAPGFIRMAGPFLDEAGEMCGSLFIFEADDRAAEDPYVTGGVFASVEVRPWRVTIPWS